MYIVGTLLGLVFGGFYAGTLGAVIGGFAGLIIALMIDKSNQRARIRSIIDKIKEQEKTIQRLEHIIASSSGFQHNENEDEKFHNVAAKAEFQADKDKPAEDKTVEDKSALAVALKEVKDEAIDDDSLVVYDFNTPKTKAKMSSANVLANMSAATTTQSVHSEVSELAESPQLADSEQLDDIETDLDNKKTTEKYKPDPVLTFVHKAKDWLMRGNPILKIGAAVLFLGLAFLLRYISQHTYFPVEVRYILVALAALVLIALGWFLRKKRASYALVLQGLGVGVFYLTIFAAIKLNPLISPSAGFILLIVITAAAIVLALLQNSLTLAVISTIGGFSAPVLASSGGGSSIALFSYFAILDIAIFIIAWFKAWRLLNLVGFFGTFSIGLAWALKSYVPSDYLSTQLFLIFFFLLFVSIALLFARQKLIEMPSTTQSNDVSLLKAAKQTHYVDGTLFFGVPIISFGMQFALVKNIEFGAAYSALILGLFYVFLAFGVLKRGKNAMQLLFETCLALGLIFASLAVPLGFDAEWTSSIWAIEAAGIYWLSLRQNRVLTRAFSLLLLIGATLSWFGTFKSYDLGDGLTVIHASKLGTVLIACALLFTWWQVKKADMTKMMHWEKPVCPFLACCATIVIGLAPSVFLSYNEATIVTAILGAIMLIAGLKYFEPVMKITAAGVLAYAGIIYLSNYNLKLMIGFYEPAFLPVLILSLSLLVSGLIVHSQKQKSQPLDKRLELFLLGYMLVAWAFAIFVTLNYSKVHLYEMHGILAMSIATVLLWGVIAQRFKWKSLADICLCFAPYVFVIFISISCKNFLYYGYENAVANIIYQPLKNWGWLTWSAAIVLHLSLLAKLSPLCSKSLLRIAHISGAWFVTGFVSSVCGAALMNVSGEFNAWRWLGWIVGPVAYLLTIITMNKKWPITMDPKAYRFIAAVPMAIVLMIWIWCANIINDGSAAPLSYISIINPLELGLLITLFTLIFWVKREPMISKRLDLKFVTTCFGLTAFVILTAIILRTVHHSSGVIWNFYALWTSSIAQTSLSIVWAFSALAAMLVGSKKHSRILWSCGAILSGIVVLKLLAVDLSNSGTMERIVSFIGVGVLLLVIGYFAPLPPKELDNQAKNDEKEKQS